MVQTKLHAEYSNQIEYINTTVKDILILTRDYIHLGAKLLNHPVSGNLAPGENPYKSLVIMEKEEFAPIVTDFYSLTLIENAIELYKAPPGSFTELDEGTLEDFKLLDFDLLQNCIKKQI
jgi:hypothetical protein